MVEGSALRNSTTISVPSGVDETSEPLLTSFRFGFEAESDGESETDFDANRLKKTFILEMQNAAGDRWRIKKDRYLCIASLICLIIMVVQNILIWQLANNDDPSRHGIVVDEEKHPTLYKIVIAMNVTTAALTILALILLTQYYYEVYKVKYNRWLQTIRKDTDGKITGKISQRNLPFARPLFFKYLLEITIQLIYPYPFLSRETFAYQALQLGMFLRLYLVLRIIHTTSRAFRKRGQIRSQYQDFRRMNLRVNWKLTLKMAFYKHMWTMIATIAVCINFVLAFGLYVVERDTIDGDKFDDLGNCLWFSFVTFSTIGYGDMVPTTASGKVTTVLLGVFGHIVMACFGGIVTNKLAPTKTQQLITEYLENDEADGHYRVAAATLIQSIWRAYTSRKTQKKKSEKTRPGAAHALVQKMRQPALQNAMRTREMVATAVKRFRHRRYQLAKSNLQAIDPVIDEKLDSLKTQLDEQAGQINRILTMLESNANANSGSQSPTSFEDQARKKGAAPTAFGSPLGMGDRRRSQLFSFRGNKGTFRQSPVHNPIRKPSLTRGSNPATVTTPPEHSPISLGDSRLQKESKPNLGRRPSLRTALVGNNGLPTIQLQQGSEVDSMGFSLSMIPDVSPSKPTHLSLPTGTAAGQKDKLPVDRNPLSLAALDVNDHRRRSLDVPDLTTKKTVPIGGHPAGMTSPTKPPLELLWNPDRSTDSGSSCVESFDLDILTRSPSLTKRAALFDDIPVVADPKTKKRGSRKKDSSRNKAVSEPEQPIRNREKKKEKKRNREKEKKEKNTDTDNNATSDTWNKPGKVLSLPHRNFSINPRDL